MLKSCLALGAAAAMFATLSGLSGSASAAPMTPLAAGAMPAVDSHIVKVHGWHPWCEWGPGGYHRHVPGGGRVRCHDGRDHRRNRCEHHRRECADEYGWGNWKYRRCVRRHGC